MNGRRARVGRVIALVVTVSALLAVASTGAGAAGPAITSVNPPSGPVGTAVTVTGSGFAAGDTVAFNGTTASHPKVSADGTTIKVKVPPFATSGPLRVSDPAGAAAEAPFSVTDGISMKPDLLWAGQKAKVAGSALPSGQPVTLSIDGATVGTTRTDGHGNFLVSQRVPSSVQPGGHVLQANCPICAAPYPIAFRIYDDWPQPRFDAANSGDNAGEFLLGTSDVPYLDEQYSSTALSPVYTAPVEYRGRVYVGTKGFDLDEGVHLLGWSFTGKPALAYEGMDGDVTQPPVVDNGVVYAVTNDTLYAFPALGTTCTLCSALWTAPLNGTAPFAPVVANGDVVVATGTVLQGFDAAGKHLCSGSPKVCGEVFQVGFSQILGPPAVDPATGFFYLVEKHGANNVLAKVDISCCVTESAPIGSYTFSAPTLAAGRVAFTVATNLTTTLLVYDESSLSLLWQNEIKGIDAIPVAMTDTRVFAVNGGGQLLVFKAGGCGGSTCKPLWSTAAVGTSDSVPPSLADGIVYIARTTGSAGSTAAIVAFDEGGSLSCSGTPKVCAPILTAVPATVGDATGITPAAGWVFTTSGGQVQGFQPLPH